MNMQEQLDREIKERIDQLAERLHRVEGFSAADIFENKYVVKAVESQKVILPSYDLKTILANFPFTETLCVVICPECSCVSVLVQRKLDKSSLRLRDLAFGKEVFLGIGEIAEMF